METESRRSPLATCEQPNAVTRDLVNKKKIDGALIVMNVRCSERFILFITVILDPIRRN